MIVMKKRKKERVKMSFWGLFKYALGRKVLIVFSPDFREVDMKDGYLRRVAFCDGLMSERKRIVLDLEKKVKKTMIQKRGKKVVVTFSRNRLVRIIWVNILLLLNHEVYCESVWQVRKMVLWLPFVKLIVDVHGAVPEEEFLYRKFESAARYGDIEEVVVQKAQYLFCVTEAMEEHLRRKYGEKMRAKVEILPIMDGVREVDEKKVLAGKKNQGVLAVYAGGIFKWQNIELMSKIMKQNREVKYEIYTPSVAGFWKIFGGGDRSGVKAATVAPKELREKIYPKVDYGFVLRDDIVVNNVACPTKISEYMEYGIIPIVKSEKIGDFVALGMKYIRDEDFAAGKLYTEAERREIIVNNLRVLKKYYEIGEQGMRRFREVMAGEGVAGGEAAR